MSPHIGWPSIDLALTADEQNTRHARSLLDQFDPALFRAFERANSLLADLQPRFSAVFVDDADQIELDRCDRGLALPREELNRLYAGGPVPTGFTKEQRKLIEGGRLAIARAASRRARGTMAIHLAKCFLFAATDFLRFRVTPAEGYLRLQAECVATMCLMVERPLVVNKWERIRTDEDGLKFHKKHSADLNRIMERLRLKEAYDLGSGAAFHARLASVVRGLESRSFEKDGRSVHELTVRLQEIDINRPELYLIDAILVLLYTQARIFAAIPSALPEIDSNSLLPAYQEFQRDLSALFLRFIQRFPDYGRRWTDEHGFELQPDGTIRRKGD
jgi:hypothetical protein